MEGGAYIEPHDEFYGNTLIRDFDTTDPEMAGKDILDMVIPAARRRGMKVMPELMEPVFKYAGHGSVNNVAIANLPQVLEVDIFGRYGHEPCTNNPDYRRWWHSIIEDQCRSYDIDGIMWCNERRSPLDLMIGQVPTCFCEHCRREAMSAASTSNGCKAFFGGLRILPGRAHGRRVCRRIDHRVPARALRNPEILIWERFWLERNKDLDRELYGLVKWCNADLEFGLNVWNRNHFNPFRKAQWPWAEMAEWSDWVKPITYQHQSGQVYTKEMSDFHKSILRDCTPQEMTPIMYKFLGLNEAPWDDLMSGRAWTPTPMSTANVPTRCPGCTGSPRLHGHRRRRATHPGRHGRLYARHRLSQRPGDLSRRRQGRDLCAQLCQHEPGHPRWRCTGTGKLDLLSS